MAATINDIAREAGVSIATVSKVINNKAHVSPDTRKRVLQVMEQLHYTPNASAANLARRSSKNVLYADRFYKGLPYENPHMFDIICGASHELSRKGYRLSLLNLDSCGKKPEEVFEEAILSRVADGIIVSSAFVTPHVERLMLRYDFPQICIGEPGFDTVLSWIDTNNTLSSDLAVEHLLSTGCRTLAFMGGRREDRIFMDRLRGFRSAMEKRGLELREEYITYNPPEVEAIARSAAALLELPGRPPAVIDADALILLSRNRALLSRLTSADILTPHPGEAAALLAADTRQIQAQRPAALARLCGLSPAAVVLKGAGTLAGQSGRPVLISPYAIPALAMGGSGDVLAGCIAALLAQTGAGCRDALRVAATGVALHALAGRICARDFPLRGVRASELADALPHARATPGDPPATGGERCIPWPN